MRQAKGKTKSEKGIKNASSNASSLLPHDLQNLASSSFAVPQVAHAAG